MGVFDSTIKKINNLLGLTALGQTTKSGSLPVTLASDQGALPVSDNAGSLTVDSTQLPPARGNQAMADSLSITFANNESRMPTSLGAKPSSASWPVVLANDHANVNVSWSSAKDVNAKSNAVDHAAPAGEIYPLAGMFDEVSIPIVDENDLGRLRMTARRALLDAADHWSSTLINALPADANLNSLALSLGGARKVSFYVLNTLNVTVTIYVRLYASVYVFSEQVPTNGALLILPADGGPGMVDLVRCVPALNALCFPDLTVAYQCASAPVSGSLIILAGLSS